MELVIDQLGYKLTPYTSGLCYVLWKYQPERLVTKGPHRGKTAAAGWKSLDNYPRTIEAGLQHIMELEANADPSTCDLEGAVKKLGVIRDSILQADWVQSE
jgi:hypothetical protein